MENSLGKIYIKKRTASEWLVAFVFFLPFVQAFLAELIGLPDAIKFLADVALVFLLIKIFMISGDVQIGKPFHPFLVLIGIFLSYVTLLYFFNFESIFYFLWGFRNYFRFYLAFVAYVIFLKWDDVQKWLKILDWVYVLNFFVVVVQFLMGFRQDFLGGIFGVQKGCNGGLLIFLTIIVTKSILEFMRNEGSTLKCVLFSFMGLLISALAELKFFFILFIVIAIMAAIMTKNSVKKTLFFVFGAVMIIIFSTILATMYDEFAGFLSIGNLWDAILNPNYATKEDIGRFTAIPIISDRFLPGFFDRLFGMGLGNADTSSLTVFNTPFFEANSSLHYAIFSYSFLYLETGILGLILYSIFFIISLVVALKLYKAKLADGLTCQLSMIFSVTCVAFMFYNVSLRSETAAYLAFFALALPLISARAAKPRKEVKI